MQGTGTQADPYIPATWSEFVTAVGKSGVYVSLPEGGGVFDMNEIAPEGGIKVTFSCIKIDGNGWSIENSFNINFLATSYNARIHDLNFLNFYINKDENLFECNDTSFDNCKFSGIIATNYIPFYKVYLNRCSINCQFIGNTQSFLSSYSECTFCNILLDHSKTTRTSISMNLNGDYNFYEHRIKDGVTRTPTINGKANIWHESSTGGLITDTEGNSHEVTEEQLKNAAYLRSIGFPIAGE